MEIPSYFRRYLTAIQPTRANRERASDLHATLTSRLVGDAPFQDWYAGTYLYGSYRRNTAVQPIKDVDICVLLDIDPDGHRPEAVVRRLRRVLERNGYKDKTALQRRSVRIDMSGTTLDVVPVVPVDGDDQPLLIPDRPLQEWVTTHPKGHLAAATDLNKASNKRYIPFVKIVKAWYRHQLRDLRGVERPKPKGFTLEALVARYQDPDAPSYAEAFVTFLDNLHVDCGAALARGTFPDVPDPGLPGEVVKVRIEPDEAKLFGTIVEGTLAEARAALALDGIKASAEAWRRILGPAFPTVPATTTEAAARQAAELEEGDEAQDEEVAAIDLPATAPTGLLRLRAELAHERGGRIIQRYPSGSRPLAKRMWLRFSIERTSVPTPYNVRWIVTNHGREARAADHLTHTTDGTAPIQWESTAYRGSHTMTCELHRNGVVFARARHTVNIK